MDDHYHYNVLGLKDNASLIQITKAWKNLALIYHPVFYIRKNNIFTLRIKTILIK